MAAATLLAALALIKRISCVRGGSRARRRAVWEGSRHLYGHELVIQARSRILTEADLLSVHAAKRTGKTVHPCSVSRFFLCSRFLLYYDYYCFFLLLLLLLLLVIIIVIILIKGKALSICVYLIRLFCRLKNITVPAGEK